MARLATSELLDMRSHRLSPDPKRLDYGLDPVGVSPTSIADLTGDPPSVVRDRVIIANPPLFLSRVRPGAGLTEG